MAVYYVNSGAGGAASGLSWADAHLTIDAAFTDATNPVVAGDVILVHSAHAETNAGTTTIGSTALNPSLQDHVWIISVDKDSSNAITSGASVSANRVNIGNANDVGMSFVGVTMHCSDQSGAGNIVKPSDVSLGMYDCTCEVGSYGGSSTTIYLSKNDAPADLLNLTIDWDTGSTATGKVGLPANAKGLTLTGRTAVTDIVNGTTNESSGTLKIEVDGLDISAFTAATTEMFSALNVENGATDISQFAGVHLPTGTFNFPGPALNDVAGYHTMYNASTGSNLYGLQHESYGGTVTDDITTYLNADLNGTGFSLNYVGNANCKQCAPVGFNLPLCEFWADANATIKINFTTVDTLDKGDTWIYIGYPDATDASLRKWISTRDFKGIDTGTLGTPGSLTTNSAAWTAGKTNDYEISQTLTSSAGPVIVYFMSAQASVDIFVDPEPEIS
jgi:hypothetical protein